MALLLKPIHCPHCQQPINKGLLQKHGALKAFLGSKPFPCPHCEQQVLFPENGDQVLSIGLLLTVILAPLFHLWQVDFIDSRVLLGLGIATIIVGIFTQKLDKA
tara:strand:+ start:1901 stop:2212 length:312 start_codon:yes stop_codon:yes gene_type:complete